MIVPFLATCSVRRRALASHPILPAGRTGPEKRNQSFVLPRFRDLLRATPTNKKSLSFQALADFKGQADKPAVPPLIGSGQEPSHEHANTCPASNAGSRSGYSALRPFPFPSANHLPTSYCGIHTIARSLRAPLLTLLSPQRFQLLSCGANLACRNFPVKSFVSAAFRGHERWTHRLRHPKACARSRPRDRRLKCWKAR